MPNPPNPNLLDVTIRDGSNLINHQYTPERVGQIAKALSDAGIKYAEICHGLGIGAKMMGYPARVDDEELLEAAKEAAPNLNLGVFINANDFSLPLIPALVEFFEIGRVGVDVSQVSTAEKVINKLKKYQKKVSLQLIRTHVQPPDFVAQAAKEAEQMGVDIVYIVDTFGSFLPSDTEAYVSEVKNNISVEVGFHGHNTFALAIPNTLQAWKNGATWLDGSLMGVGRGAGNAVLEVLVQTLQLEGQAQELSVKNLCRATSDIVRPLFGKPPYSGWLYLLSAKNKIYYEPQDFLELLANSLAIPLSQFMDLLKSKMCSPGLLTEGELKSILDNAGYDYDSLVKPLGSPHG